MEIELKLTNDDGGPLDIKIFVPQMLNWSIDVPDGDSNLQTSSLLGNATSGYNVANFSQTDAYNNSIDYYQKTMPDATSFTLTMNYTIIANQIRWETLGTPQMADYDTGPFYQLYTQDQPPFINITDPLIVATAAMMCGGDTNPVTKARKIYNWLSHNLTYQVQTGTGTDGTGEMGASWALANLRGDCSEYSDLMVAMLRAQGVPARKVVGLALLDPSGSHLPSYAQGATWIYARQGGIDNFTGHAWMEYFVPGSGWVACDPTWGNGGEDYFNYIDYLHVSSCRGEYFGDEVYPTLSSLSLPFDEIGEYPFLPLVVYPSGAHLSSAITTRFTVIESNIWIDYTLVVILVVIVLLVAIIGIIYWVTRKRRE